MSYNFAFWAGGDDLDPGDVYPQLNGEQHVVGVEPVNPDRIVQAFADHLATWKWDGQILQPPGADPDGTPAFDVSIGDQLVEFIGYGFEHEHANAIIDAMHPLGFRLFDPQTGERFA